MRFSLRRFLALGTAVAAAGALVAFGQQAKAAPTAQFVIATGTGQGGGPHVKLFTTDGVEQSSFMAYDENFRGGVNVAVGDLDGDGQIEIITAAGPGGGPHVKIFTESGSFITGFFAYVSAFKGGVNVGVSDVDGDGDDEILTAPASGGGPHVKVINVSESGGVSLSKEFSAYDPKFLGGVTVAGVYVDTSDNEGIAVGAGPGGGPHVKTFKADLTQVGSWFAYADNYLGGVSVTGWFSNDDEIEEVLTGSLAGPGHVRSWNANGTTTDAGGVNWFAFPGTERGANVATIDPEDGGPILIGPNRGIGATISRNAGNGATAPSINPYPGFGGGVKIATAFGLFDSGPTTTTTSTSTTTTTLPTSTTSSSTTSSTSTSTTSTSTTSTSTTSTSTTTTTI